MHDEDTSLDERSPPWNPEAEQALISGILLDQTGAIMYRLAPIIKPEAFYDRRNGMIYKVCVALHDANKPVEVLFIKDTLLKMKNKIVQDGYLAEIAGAGGSPAHVEMSAALINEAAERRALLKASARAIEECHDGADATEIARALEKAVNETTEKQHSLEVSRPGDGIAGAIATAQAEGEGKSKNPPLKWMVCPRFDAGGAYIRATDFAVMAARPGVGKTTFALQWAKVQAQQTGRPVVFISLETTAPDLWLKVACCHGGVPEPKGGALEPLHEQAMQEAARSLDGVCDLIIPVDPPSNLWDLRSMISNLKQRYDPIAIVIDYLGLIEVPYTKNEYEAVSKASRVMRTWARRNGTAIVMIHQLNRSSEREARPPAMHDLRGSGQIEQDATHICFLHLERVHDDGHTRDVTAILAKSRRGGAPNTQQLTLFGQLSRFAARKSTPKLDQPA